MLDLGAQTPRAEGNRQERAIRFQLANCSRLIREPLVHFLVLGAGLFLLYGYISGKGPDRVDRIVVKEADVAWLSEQFQRTWMRPPTRQELQGLVEEFVKEEILYREALALGLDKDDLVVRRRMRQKLEFLNADLLEPRRPTDAELHAYLDANPEQFRLPARYSFHQIYLNPEASGGDAQQRAADLLTRLRADPSLDTDPQPLGDSTLLPRSLKLASKREISALYGAGLADALSTMEKNVWSGPYRSSYGLHLILLTAIEDGGLPELDRVRPAVEREWSNERRQEANDRFYQALRARYAVEIRLPEDVAKRDNLAASTR